MGPGAVRGQAVSTGLAGLESRSSGPDHVGDAGCLEGVVSSTLVLEHNIRRGSCSPWKQRGGVTTAPSRGGGAHA